MCQSNCLEASKASCVLHFYSSPPDCIGDFGRLEKLEGDIKDLRAELVKIAERIGGCDCYCSKNPDKVTISLSEASKALFIDDSFQLEAIVGPECLADKSVVWHTDDTSVARGDQVGVVTAVAAGSANISATTTIGNRMASCACVVSEAKESYYIVRVEKHTEPWVNRSCVIGEIELYRGDELIPYTLTDVDVYDSHANGVPSTWLLQKVGKGQLHDGIRETRLNEGCRLFVNCGDGPAWAEFLLLTREGIQLSHADFWVGGYVDLNRKTPHQISLYAWEGEEKPVCGESRVLCKRSKWKMGLVISGLELKSSKQARLL